MIENFHTHFDFRPLGAAIKKARVDAGYTRHKACAILNISPRYLANIENKGQHPSVQVLYELVAFFNVPISQYFLPGNVSARQPETKEDKLLCYTKQLSDAEMDVLLATAEALVRMRKAK